MAGEGRGGKKLAGHATLQGFMKKHSPDSFFSFGI
jgi:hypothetical protein